MTHRQDLNSLSGTDRQTLVDLMLAYLTDDIVSDHLAITHSGEDIFTGHRAYIAGMESYLSANGGGSFVPLPMWNPSNPIPDEFNVVRPQDDGTTRTPLNNLDPQMQLPAQYEFPAVCDNYDTAEDLGNAIDPWHGSVHGAIGGSMGSFTHAPAAPIFWCWHAFIDDVYYNWQNCNVTVPKCTGYSLGIAKIILKNNGLKVGRINRWPWWIIPKWRLKKILRSTWEERRVEKEITRIEFLRRWPRIIKGPRVISQSPRRGESVREGSSVDLTVYESR